jgi:hypothetical protein
VIDILPALHLFGEHFLEVGFQLHQHLARLKLELKKLELMKLSR